MPDVAVSIAGWLAAVSRFIEPVYPWLNGLHILSLGLLVGAIALLDLRLLGAFRGMVVAQLAVPATRLAACGLFGAMLTGILLFSAQPAHYLDNDVFLAKLAIVAAGLINAAVLRASAGWRRMLRGEPVSSGVRLMAAISLSAWVAAVFAGRWIAYL